MKERVLDWLAVVLAVVAIFCALGWWQSLKVVRELTPVSQSNVKLQAQLAEFHAYEESGSQDNRALYESTTDPVVLLAGLTHERCDLRALCAERLAELDPDGAACAKLVMLDMLEHGCICGHMCNYPSGWAALALAKLAPDSPEIAQAIARRFNPDGSWHNNIAYADALAEFDALHGTETQLHELIAASDHPLVVLAAGETLEKFFPTDSKLVTQRIIALLRLEDPTSSWAPSMMDWLAAHPAEAKAAIPVLEKFLGDQCNQVQAQETIDAIKAANPS